MDYNIGDIIKFNNMPEKTEYYIITDYEDFSDEVWYQLAMIYPVSHVATLLHTSDRNFKILAKHGTKGSEIIFDFINRERFKMNISGEPSYMSMIERNLNSYERTVERVSQVDESIIEKRIQVDFNQIKSIDEGLDLMNHFGFLARILEDDRYLEAVKMVEDRLKELK